MSAPTEPLTEAPRPLPDAVAADVATLVFRLLERDPADRPREAASVAAEAVALCTRLGWRTTRPRRDLLGSEVPADAPVGGDTARLVS